MAEQMALCVCGHPRDGEFGHDVMGAGNCGGNMGTCPCTKYAPTASPKADEGTADDVISALHNALAFVVEQHKCCKKLAAVSVAVDMATAWNTRVAPAPDPRVEEIRKRLKHVTDGPSAANAMVLINAIDDIRYLLSLLDGKEQR